MKKRDISPALRDFLKSTWKETDTAPREDPNPRNDENLPTSPEKSGPERLIGPRNPDHPQVNTKKGGRDPT